MKYKIIFSAIAVCIVFSNFRIFAQDTVNQTVPKFFGLGIHIEQYISNNYGMNVYAEPTNRIALTIAPIKNFRLEPETGINFSNNKDNGCKSKTIYYGLGAFGMYQRGKVNFYGGLRLGYTYISSEYFDFNSGAKTAGEAKTFSYGPAVGSEYFLGSHFSIGAEIGIKFSNLNSKDLQYDIDDDYFYISTHAGILLRFYF